MVWCRRDFFPRKCNYLCPPFRSRRRGAGLFLSRWALAAFLQAVFVTTASAVNYTVSTSFDNGAYLVGEGSGTSGDLRYCIVQANGNPGSTITFGSLTINTTRGMPPITASMTIRTSFPGIGGIDGQNLARLFFIDAPGATVTLEGLRLANGRAKGGDGAEGLAAGWARAEQFL